MKTKWESKELHEHPAPHQAGTYGRVILTDMNIYCLKVGGAIMSCSQIWAAKIHASEQ